MLVLEGSKLEQAKPVIAEGNMPANAADFEIQGTPRASKLKISIEKKIENVWLEWRELGWTYNEFVAHLLEVLVVLNHRTIAPKLNAEENTSQRVTTP